MTAFSGDVPKNTNCTPNMEIDLLDSENSGHSMSSDFGTYIRVRSGIESDTLLTTCIQTVYNIYCSLFRETFFFTLNFRSQYCSSKFA